MARYAMKNVRCSSIPTFSSIAALIFNAQHRVSEQSIGIIIELYDHLRIFFLSFQALPIPNYIAILIFFQLTTSETRKNKNYE